VFSYSREELLSMSFRSLGENVEISKTAIIPDPSKISIGNNVRIDDYGLMTGWIWIGDYVHVSAYCSLGGRAEIFLNDFVALAPGVRIFSASDDYSGKSLVGPCVPDEFRNIQQGAVTISKHVIIGSNSVVLPGVEIGLGSAVGAMSLVRKSIPEFKIYGGVPAKELADRSKNCLEMEKKLCES